MATRRDLLIGAAALAAFGLTPARAEEAASGLAVSPEGLLTEPWFLESFLDLTDDLASAHKAGKRLAIMWELRG